MLNSVTFTLVGAFPIEIIFGSTTDTLGHCSDVIEGPIHGWARLASEHAAVLVHLHKQTVQNCKAAHSETLCSVEQ